MQFTDMVSPVYRRHLYIFLKIVVLLFCVSTLRATKPESNPFYLYTYSANKDDSDSKKKIHKNISTLLTISTQTHISLYMSTTWAWWIQFRGS